MPSSNGWIRSIMLGLSIAMVVALLYTAYVLSTTPKRLTQVGIHSVEPTTQPDPAPAQTLQAIAGVLDTHAHALGTPAAEAERAVAAAETAVAAIQTAAAQMQPTITPTPASTVEAIPLNGGVSVAYQAPDGPGLALYPVYYAAAYRNYAEFEQDWPLDDTATARFALIETKDGSEEWHLFHTGLITMTGVIPTEWTEYALLLEPESNVVEFVTGPEQTIVTSTLFTVEVGADTETSLFGLEDSGADLNLASRLLLVDSSSGEIKYILIIFDPVSGAGGTRWCSNCRARFCGWLCRRIRWK